MRFGIQFDRESTSCLLVSFDSPVLHLKGTDLIPVLANDLQADGELPRRHVLRYLHSLVQPYSSASDLVAYFANSPNLPLPLRFDVYHMDVTCHAAERGRNLRDAHYERIVDELLQPRDTDASESSLRSFVIARGSFVSFLIYSFMINSGLDLLDVHSSTPWMHSLDPTSESEHVAYLNSS